MKPTSRPHIPVRLEVGHAQDAKTERLHVRRSDSDVSLCGKEWNRPTPHIRLSVFQADARDGCKACIAASRRLVDGKTVAHYEPVR